MTGFCDFVEEFFWPKSLPEVNTVYYPFKSQYPHTDSSNWSLYISLKNGLREFNERSRFFLIGDHFINSHSIIS